MADLSNLFKSIKNIKSYKLKNNKTLTYYDNNWYINGKPVNTKNFTYIDKRGYRKKLLPDGTMAVQDVDKSGNPIKHSYIGSNTVIPKKGTPGRQAIVDKVNAETAAKYWATHPIMRHATDSIAERYSINPSLLRYRLDKEGFTQGAIANNNAGEDASSYNALNTNFNWSVKDDNGNIYPTSPGFSGFGLDDVATMIKQGQVHPINENWSESQNINEKGRLVHTADGDSNAANMGLTAATLKYFRDLAKKDFPNSNRMFLDEAASTYYNYGPYGGKREMKNKNR